MDWLEVREDNARRVLVDSKGVARIWSAVGNVNFVISYLKSSITRPEC